MASEQQNFDYEFDAVKEEVDVQVIGDDGKSGSVDHMYMKVNFLWLFIFTTSSGLGLLVQSSVPAVFYTT